MNTKILVHRINVCIYMRKQGYTITRTFFLNKILTFTVLANCIRKHSIHIIIFIWTDIISIHIDSWKINCSLIKFHHRSRNFKILFVTYQDDLRIIFKMFSLSSSFLVVWILLLCRLCWIIGELCLALLNEID